MNLDRNQAQNIIDDFVANNDAEFKRISFDNPQLFDASIMALDFLSKRFGKSEKMKKVVVEEMKQAKEEETSLDLLPFAKGEKYLSKNSNMIFEISGFTKDTDGEDMVVIINVEDGGKGFLDVDDVVSSIKDGRWVKIEDEIVESLPFAIGEAYRVNKTQLVFRIEDIRDDNVFIVYEDGLTAIVPTNSFKEALDNGYYIKSQSFTPSSTISATKSTSSSSGSSSIKEPTTSKTMSGDANNKQFLKKQKDIKKLQKEIDGLEALEDEFMDDEIRDLIKQKKSELEALKK